MLANRNPDIPIYLEKYEKWKKEANKFKQDIKDGTKTEEEFNNCINELYNHIKCINCENDKNTDNSL